MINEHACRKIVVVGSAPIHIDYSTFVDDAEVVVRFNDCKNIGGASGHKTDILFVNNTGSPAMRYIAERPFALKSCCQSAVIWFVRDSVVHHAHFQKVKTIFQRYPVTDLDDLTEQIIDANQLQDRETHRVSRAFNEEIFDKLSLLSSSPFICPSTGFIGLMHILADSAYTNCEIHVVGFGFEGWKGHPWSAEKKLINRYVLDGRLTIHPNTLPPPGIWARVKNIWSRGLAKKTLN